MAQKPDGSSIGPERVTFTRPAAQRIARVVRTVESGDRAQEGLTFQHVAAGGFSGKSIRLATFSGSWNINTAKNVTFKNAPTATANATNLFWPITPTGYTNETVMIGKEGTAWYLVVPPLAVSTAQFVVSVAVAATLNTNSCSINVSTSSTTATASFLCIKVP